MKIIVIEGTDGSGKQTQSKILKSNLEKNNYHVVLQSFPNYENKSSMHVKMYLNGDFGTDAIKINAYQASTLFAVDRFITMQALVPTLNKETVLILDRYTTSNLIHQASKIRNIEKRNYFIDWLINYEYELLKLPKPDLTFFLDMPPNKSIVLANARTKLKSGTKNDIHENNSKLLIDSYRVGKDVAKKFNWHTVSCVNADNIKAEKEISNEILYETLKFLKN